MEPGRLLLVSSKQADENDEKRRTNQKNLREGHWMDYMTFEPAWLMSAGCTGCCILVTAWLGPVRQMVYLSIAMEDSIFSLM